MTAGDKAALNSSLAAANQQSGAQQQAIMQHAAETGQAGGGSSLAAALQGEQNAAGANSAAALGAASASQNRQQAARSQVGAMGANINQAATQRQQAAAEAENAINAANTNATNQASEFNAQSQNQASLANQAANNAASQFNSNAVNQQFQNQLGEDQARSGAEQASTNAGIGVLQAGAAGAGAMIGAAHGGEIQAPSDYRDGGRVPGRAPLAGDHAENDNVDAKLSKGEVVVPRSVVAQGPKSMYEFLCRAVAGHKPADKVAKPTKKAE